MSLSIATYPFPRGCGVLLLEPIPALSQGEGRVLPGWVASSSQGPHWWAMWGSVSHSRTLRHAAQPRAGIWTSDLPITGRPALPADLHPPLSWSFCSQISAELSQVGVTLRGSGRATVKMINPLIQITIYSLLWSHPKVKSSTDGKKKTSVRWPSLTPSDWMHRHKNKYKPASLPALNGLNKWVSQVESAGGCELWEE